MKERPLDSKETATFLNGRKGRCEEGICDFESWVRYEDGQTKYETHCGTCNKRIVDARIVYETPKFTQGEKPEGKGMETQKQNTNVVKD